MTEKPALHAFMVYYIKTVSTWNNEWQQHGKRIIMLASRPLGKDRTRLQSKMEDDYINQQSRKNRKNLADVNYKITRIVAITPKK